MKKRILFAGAFVLAIGAAVVTKANANDARFAVFEKSGTSCVASSCSGGTITCTQTVYSNSACTTIVSSPKHS